MTDSSTISDSLFYARFEKGHPIVPAFDKEESAWYNKENTKNDTKKEVPDMSFVGVEYFHGKMIGFADKKSSKIVNGTMRESSEHRPVQKLLSSDQSIVVLCGANTLVTVENEYSDHADVTSVNYRLLK